MIFNAPPGFVALWTFEKHVVLLYQAKFEGFGPNFSPSRIKTKILTLCNQIKKDALSLVDVFAPPDFVLNSCLGASDGKVYERIYEAVSQSEGCFDKPAWYTFEVGSQSKL